MFFIDPESANINQFKIQGRKIRYMGQFVWTQLLGRVPISQKNTFTVKIVITRWKNIAVGVIDSRQKNIRRIDYNSDFIICYDASFGRVWGNGKPALKFMDKKGYFSQDMVTVKVDQQKGQIQWLINGVSKCIYPMEGLKNKDIQWVPYLCVYDFGDEIQWIQ